MTLTAYIDKKMATTYTSVSVRTLDYARGRGELPYHRVGRKILFKITDLDAWLLSQRIDIEEEVSS